MWKFFLSLCLFFASAYLMSSCEREVNFDLGDTTRKVVIEGNIENGLPPFVLLSKSIGFFSSIDLNTLSESFLHDAVITVSDGEKTVLLREYQSSISGISYYFYTIDTADAMSLLFKGEEGKTYSLKVEYQGEVFESQTQIPYITALDSLWFITPPPSELPENNPDAVSLYAQYTDPDTPGNKARYFTSVNGASFLPAYYSVYDDEIVNGTTVSIPLYAGFDKMDTLNYETYGYFQKGDTVIVKWCSIDNGVFNFWRTLEFSYGSTGNPFASPVQITSNIQGGALGVWAGYGAYYDTIIIND